MAFFESMKLDATRAASVQFLKYLNISLSDQEKKYESQTQTINTKVDTITNFMIGGEPP